MIDAHCHILPCCDDGSDKLDTSIEMLNTARALGIDKIICTSHIKHSGDSHDDHMKQYKALLPYAKEACIELALGAELNWKKYNNFNAEGLRQLCLGNSNILLLEFSSNGLPSFWESMVYKLLGEGLQVVIVHPERFREVHQNYDLLYDFINAGCKIMLSAVSFDKKLFGSRTHRVAKHMLKDSIIDFIASDAHSVANYKYLTPALKLATKHGYDVDKADSFLEGAFSE